MRLTATPLCIATAVALGFFAVPAMATTWEIEGGRSYSDSRGTDALFAEGVFDTSPIGSSRFSWEPDVSLGWIKGRNLANDDKSGYSPRGNSGIAAAGARFQYGDQGDWYRHLFFSFQPAYNSGRTPALSSPYEFVSTLGWQGRIFSFQVRHISNGGIHDPNRGETMALVGVGFTL